jgi:hypothetical protein
MPNQKTTKPRLAPEQILAVIAAAKSKRDKAMIAVIADCKLLRSEVACLVRPGRGAPPRILDRRGRDRAARLSQATIKLLDEYLAERLDSSPALFLSRKNGTSVGGHAIFVAFRSAARTAGLPKELQHPRCLLRKPVGKNLKFAVRVAGLGMSKEFDSMDQCAYAMARAAKAAPGHGVEALVRRGNGDWLPISWPSPALEAFKAALLGPLGAKPEGDGPEVASKPETPPQAVL